MSVSRLSKIGWSLLVLLQLASAIMLLVGSTKLRDAEVSKRTSRTSSAVELLEKAASSGVLLDQTQQAAVLQYCAGLRRDVEQSNKEVREKWLSSQSSLFWTAILLLACGTATVAFLWVDRRRST